MRLKLTLLSAFLFLSACQSVQDQSIPLHQEFKQNADQFNVKRPTWRLSDTVYQQKLQGRRETFDINGTETGWGKSEKSQHWFSESGVSIEGLEIRDKFLRIVFLDLLGMRKKAAMAMYSRTRVTLHLLSMPIEVTRFRCVAGGYLSMIKWKPPIKWAETKRNFKRRQFA
jgi:hypothetical protein